ncbi:type III secretion protein [Pseudomonas fluorescens]
MTSTSFQSCQTGCRDTFPSGRDVDCSTSVKGEDASNNAFYAALSNGYAAETQRMKAFAGQRKFQAPVADDFARGMLAPGHGGDTHTQSPRRSNGVWAALINGLTAWWHGQRSV